VLQFLIKEETVKPPSSDQVITKGRSANKFSKLQIRKFADLNNVFNLRTFRKCALCCLQNQSSFRFPDLKLPKVRKYILFLLKNIAQNALIQSTKQTKLLYKTTFRTVFRHSCAVFCKNLRIG
jgi:hypothetical protein